MHWIVLFAIFGGNALGDPRINLFAITIVVATLLVFWVIAGKVYKKLWMKLLESFFLLNLIILATSTLFLKSLEGFSVVKKQAVLTSIMVGSTALVFIGILAYQCCQEVTKKSVFKHILAKFVTNAEHDRGCAENSEGISDGSTTAEPQQPTVSVIAMNELREPLLTDMQLKWITDRPRLPNGATILAIVFFISSSLTEGINNGPNRAEHFYCLILHYVL